MKYYWRMMFASAVTMWPIESIQANMSNETHGISLQGAPQVAQGGESNVNKGLAKPPQSDYKWLIKSDDGSEKTIKLTTRGGQNRKNGQNDCSHCHWDDDHPWRNRKIR